MEPEIQESESLQALREALAAVRNNQSALAEKVNTYMEAEGSEVRVTQRHVWNWLNRNGETPANCVLAVEWATGISRHRLRRDVFGRAAEQPRQATGQIAGGCST